MTGIGSTLVWIAIIGLAVGTYALRGAFLLSIQRFDGTPPVVSDVLPLVPVAVFAALIAPELAYVGGSIAIGLENERLLAGLIAFAVAWYTENMLLTVGAGMSALWILQWL